MDRVDVPQTDLRLDDQRFVLRHDVQDRLPGGDYASRGVIADVRDDAVLGRDDLDATQDISGCVHALERIGQLQLRGLDFRRDLLLEVVSKGQDLEFRSGFGLIGLRPARGELSGLSHQLAFTRLHFRQTRAWGIALLDQGRDSLELAVEQFGLPGIGIGLRFHGLELGDLLLDGLALDIDLALEHLAPGNEEASLGTENIGRRRAA